MNGQARQRPSIEREVMIGDGRVHGSQFGSQDVERSLRYPAEITEQHVDSIMMACSLITEAIISLKRGRILLQ